MGICSFLYNGLQSQDVRPFPLWRLAGKLDGLSDSVRGHRLLLFRPEALERSGLHHRCRILVDLQRSSPDDVLRAAGRRPVYACPSFFHKRNLSAKANRLSLGLSILSSNYHFLRHRLFAFLCVSPAVLFRFCYQ